LFLTMGLVVSILGNSAPRDVSLQGTLKQRSGRGRQGSATVGAGSVTTPLLDPKLPLGLTLVITPLLDPNAFGRGAFGSRRGVMRTTSALGR